MLFGGHSVNFSQNVINLKAAGCKTKGIEIWGGGEQ